LLFTPYGGRITLETITKYCLVLGMILLLTACAGGSKTEKKDKNLAIEEHFQLARNAAERGNLDEAVRQYKRVLELDPKNAKAHLNLGIVYGRQWNLIIEPPKDILDLAAYHLEQLPKTSMWKKEVSEYKEALRIDPNFAEAHFNLGVAYQEKGNHKEAIAEYQKTLQIYPNYLEAHNNLGILYFRNGLLDQAFMEYQRTIEIKPDYAKGYYNIGGVYREKKKMDEAITSFQKALEINPNFAEAHYSLAVMYYEKQEFKLAIEHCDQARKLGIPVDPKFLERLKPYR
jgi:tetratricopeptide (TPR) repeat protein